MKRAIFLVTGLIMGVSFLSGCTDKKRSSSETVKTAGEQSAEDQPPSGNFSKASNQTAAAIEQIKQSRATAGTSSNTGTNLLTQPLQRVEAPSELLERAEKGDVTAQRDLGKFYSDNGEVGKAIEWYRKAATQGDAEAQRILGIAHIFGTGTDRNMAEAGKWLLLAAEQGDAIAQRELGKIYGDQWKYTESNDWYLKAALQGDAEAQRMLGLRYTIGQGVESDRGEAIRWLSMAANQGDAISQRELGKLYGEEWKLKESNEWYLKAAAQGDMRAQHMMGVRYTFGQGVPQNIEEAGKWFLLAAEQGDAQSQFSLGVRWARGEAGEPQDFAEAAKWFALAANQGLDNAQLSLSRRYASGEGVPQDYVEAYKWATLAQNQGKVQGAGKLIAEVLPKMTPDQVKQAKQQVSTFVPQPPRPLR